MLQTLVLETPVFPRLGISTLVKPTKIDSESESEVAQSCPALCDPMDCSPSGSSVHGILQARILEWVAISFSRGISPTQGSNLGLPHCRQTLNHLSHQLISSCLNSNHPLDFYSFSKHPSEPDAAQAAVGALHLLRAFPCILTAHLCFQLPTKSSLPGALLLA